LDNCMALKPLANTSKAFVILTVGVLAALAMFLESTMIFQHAAVIWLGPDLADEHNSSHAWRLDKQFCEQQPVSLSCAPGGWTPLPSDETFLEGVAACNQLAACNFTKVAFVGDRYAGHGTIVAGGRQCNCGYSNGCLSAPNTRGPSVAYPSAGIAFATCSSCDTVTL
jgi:hypothetical protein